MIVMVFLLCVLIFVLGYDLSNILKRLKRTREVHVREDEIELTQEHVEGLHMFGIPINQIRKFLDRHRPPYSG